MPSLFDSESLLGSREPLQEGAVWRFDLLARGTRLSELGVFSAADFTHAACASGRKDFVESETSPT